MMMRHQSAHTNPLLVGRELKPEHKGYLAARAVSLDIAKQAGLCSVSRKEAEEFLGFAFPSKEGGLWTPYPGPDDFGRLRLDEPFPNKKEKPTRYLTPKEEVRPYLAPFVDDANWQDAEKPLHIVESPIKALALIGAGWLSIGLAGVRTGHQKGAAVSRLHDLIIDQVKLLKRRVVILFDAGRAINKDVLSAEKKQAELYAAAGARVFVAQLPLTDTGEDQGPDDFLARFGVERLRAIIDAAKPIEEAYPKEEKAAPKKTQAQIVVELVKESSSQVWSDKQGVFWVTFEVNGHLEHHRLRSEAARRYLRQLSEKASIIPGAQSIQDAIATIEALAPQGEPQEVFVRVGEAHNKIYLDLGSPDWSAVEIDCDGWRVAKVPPVRFKRAKGMLALPIPIKGGELSELRRFLDPIPELDYRFALSWVLAALRPKGPYPIAKVNGEQGSGKSTRSRMLRALVDPNACPLRSAPRKEQDLAIAANNGWVVAYDNLSGVSEDLSDALCRVSTGGGFATRALYSDDEETLLDYQRPVLLNGIDEIATREDLADRSIPINLPRIEEENRREESEVWAAFEEARPRILGALLDIISAGLKKLPSIKAKRLPRMADFAKWILACEEALGWEPESFLASYFGVRTQMSESAIEGDLFSRSLVELIDEKAKWEGSAAELLSVLNSRVDEAVRRVKGWPQDATRIVNKLRRVSPSLLRVGFVVDLEKQDTATRRRIVCLSKAAKAVTPPLELRRNEEGKEKGEEIPSFRIDMQNSLRSLHSLQPPTGSGELPKADRRLTEGCEDLAFGANPSESQELKATKAAKAEKQTDSKGDSSQPNLNDPGSPLNGQWSVREEEDCPPW